MEAITDLFARLRHHKHEQKIAAASDIREAIVLLAGADTRKKINIDLAHYGELFEAEGLTEQDIQLNIDNYRERLRKAELVSQGDTLKNRAAEAEKAHTAADIAEAKRRKQAVGHLQELEMAASRALQDSLDVVEAQGDLVAEARTTPEEQRLIEELAAVNKTIRRLRIAIDSKFSEFTDGRSIGIGAPTWASLTEHPATLAAQTKYHIKNTDSLTKERKAELKRQQDTAEEATGAAEKELVLAEKQLARLSAKLDKFNAAKLLPESFVIVRAKPTAEALRKQHARDTGYAPAGQRA